MARRAPKHSLVRQQLSRSVASSCAQKKAYPDENRALAAAEVQMLTDMSLHLTVYQCSLCRKWHLTRRRAPEDHQTN